MGGLRLLTDPAAVHATFEDALEWCDDVAMCTPAAASSLGKWALWGALERNAKKVTAAYVALDGLRSEPAALAWLHDQGCLRFVPAADGSFRANAYRFRKAREVRILMGAGRLAPSGLMAPLDAMILWEGDAIDPFAAGVDALLARAKALAHVPTPKELQEYTSAFFSGAPLWDQLVELGAPFIRATAHDVDMPELELVVDEKTIRRAMKVVRDQLAAIATEKRRQDVRYHGGGGTYTVHWSAPLKLWVLFEKLENRYWNAFGTSRPDKENALPITVEVNPPLDGVDRKMGGAFARDPHSGDLYLVHRGRIGGGQKGVGAELFWSRFRGGINMNEPDREEPARVVVVGKVGAQNLPRDVAAFVHEVGRIKAAAG